MAIVRVAETAAHVSWRRSVLEMMVAVGAMAHEMSFIDHLEELRRRILWSVAAIAVAFAVCWIFAGDLYEIASAPIRANRAVTLSLSRPQDIFSLNVKVTLVAAIFVLARIGLLSARTLIRYLRHAVLGCIALAAVITPTTDVANMLVIASPMILLYCLGIGVAWAFGKPRAHL
jgi:Sec-independent protein secretion pathway component TatC